MRTLCAHLLEPWKAWLNERVEIPRHAVVAMWLAFVLLILGLLRDLGVT